MRGKAGLGLELGLGMIVILTTSAAMGDEVRDLVTPALKVFREDEAAAAARMLHDDVRARLQQANQKSTAAWREIKTKEDWEKKRYEWITALKKSLGHDLPPPAEVKVVKTGSLTDGIVRVEKLVIVPRSKEENEGMDGKLPDVYAKRFLEITANLYVPEQRPESMPGILLSHSHHSPKSQGELQDMGQLWARAGCYVLVIDHLGHGERRQHPFVQPEDYPAAKFQASRQDYHFRYNVAAQLYLAGDSLMGWLASDLMRGVDVLLQQPGIDPQRIILLGGVAGGGDPAGVTAAIDPRIACVVPMNFGGPQPESKFPLPDDAEETFGYAGSGSWESTRNLHRSAADGFLPWVIVGSVAPRGLIHGHEFAWDGDRDPVWKRYQKIFSFYGDKPKLGVTHGYGRLQQSEDVASHCGNVGKPHREAIHKYFREWYGIDGKEAGDKPFTRRTAAELACLPGAEPPVNMSSLNSVLAGRVFQRNLWKDRKPGNPPALSEGRDSLRKQWASILGDVAPTARIDAEDRGMSTVEPKDGPKLRIERRLLRDGQIQIPLAIVSRADKQGKRPAIVAFAQQGKEKLFNERLDMWEELLGQYTICFVDPRGCGETAPGKDRGRRSAATDISASYLMLGQTMTGARVKDVRSTLAYLRTRDDINANRLLVYGDSLAPINKTEDTASLYRPLEVDQPHLAEPMGYNVAVLTALFEGELTGIIARGGLWPSGRDVKFTFLHLPHDAIIPGEHLTGGMTFVALHGACPIWSSDVVNVLNQRANHQFSDVPNHRPMPSRFKLEAHDQDIVDWVFRLP